MEILLVLVASFILGGLPLINWVSYALTRKDLSKLGTGNISVSAAFYHCGKVVGILAVVTEAAKGIGAVYLAQSYGSTLVILSLMALVLSRYLRGKGAGTTNVTWGLLVHDPLTTILTLVVGGLIFAIWSRKDLVKWVIIGIFVFITLLRHSSELSLVSATVGLGLLISLIYLKIPDDLQLSPTRANPESVAMFKFWQGYSSKSSLAQSQKAELVGAKASNLAQLLQWGYPVPPGFVLFSGMGLKVWWDCWQALPGDKKILRSSARGEDGQQSSQAGQYLSVADLTSKDQLAQAIARCESVYRSKGDQGALILQQQITGLFSGVAFSRDPLEPWREEVVIEATPGGAQGVVSGTVTPESYRVIDQEVEGRGIIPPSLLQQVATLTRQIEQSFHGLPQDIEWTYDGSQLWILQARPITTLRPLWTRKIASEVIPGIIKPLPWSINRPLTCGVWGEIFTLVLGVRAQGLNFEDTATLHQGRAYFNATLLGDIFRRMGLPPESLEFLTRGAKMTKPPLKSTLSNLPGLLRLLRREWNLVKDFNRDDAQYFQPLLSSLTQRQSIDRVEEILLILKRATYYSILAPLSLGIRQSLGKVKEQALDNSQNPEVSSVKDLALIATQVRQSLTIDSSKNILDQVKAQSPHLLKAFHHWLDKYGYLSQVGTDISVPRWQDDPAPVEELFAQLILQPLPSSTTREVAPSWLQSRLDLKGRVNEIYSRLLSHLRNCFLDLAQQWHQAGILPETEDIFFLTWGEIKDNLATPNASAIQALIEQRKKQWRDDCDLVNIPYLVYGNNTPSEPLQNYGAISSSVLYGIGASPGVKEGVIKIVHNLAQTADIDQATIVVVPYTDAGWVPVLVKAGGLIAEVGGRLSHGAIIAREYGIPAVMDIHNCSQILRDGQRVRINGQRGVVEILDETD